MRRTKAANVTFLFFMTEGTSLVLNGGKHYFLNVLMRFLFYKKKMDLEPTMVTEVKRLLEFQSQGIHSWL